MNVRVTVTAAKMAGAVSRGLGRGGGSALPGVVAEKLDPGLAGKLAAQLPHGVIIVTGTNGKTTTTKLLGDMLAAAGERVVSNRTGSNLKRGVVSALVAASNHSGRLKGDPTIGLFEVDEANVRLVAKLVGAKHVVVTNLFRDQLDRYGELDTTAAKLGEGIEGTGAWLYLNADDPLVASLAKYATAEQVTFFGIEGLPASAATATKTAVDSDRCPVCGDELTFSRTFFGHIGHYRCHNGHFNRPQPSVAVTSVRETGPDGSSFTVALGGKRHEATLPLGGVYNLYNALAALAVATGVGVPADVALASLARSQAAFGRVERVSWNDRSLFLLLVKNPAGFTQVLDTFLRDQRQANVLMVINDLAADGRDVSWLWDVPFEVLAPSKPRVIVAGLRAGDMAVRLHYAGIEASVAESVAAGVSRLQESLKAGETGYVLPTYTAMLEVRRDLGKTVKLVEAGQ